MQYSDPFVADLSIVKQLLRMGLGNYETLYLLTIADSCQIKPHSVQRPSLDQSIEFISCWRIIAPLHLRDETLLRLNHVDMHEELVGLEICRSNHVCIVESCVP
jgi:hypothetical protein